MSNNTNNNDNAEKLENLSYKEFFELMGNTSNDPLVTEELRYKMFRNRFFNELRLELVGFSKYELKLNDS